MLRGVGLLLSRSLLWMAAETADYGWTSRQCLLLQPREYPPHVRRKGNFIPRVPCFFCPWCLELGIPEIVFPFWTIWIGKGSFPVCCPGFSPPEIEAVRGSLVEAALESGGGNGSTIWQSGGDDGEAWDAWALPLCGVASRSRVPCLIGVRALSGVRDQSEVLGTGDWPRSVQAHPVIFCLTWEERVLSKAPNLSGAFPTLAGREPPPCWLGTYNRWRILHQCNFPDYLVEGSGRQSWRALVKYLSGCSDEAILRAVSGER